MAMSINARMVPSGDARYYSAHWHRVVESHLQWIRSLPNNQVVRVQDAVAYKYEGDFMGLLQELRIPMELHWVAMRLNGYTSPTDYTYDRTSLFIPNPTTISRIFTTFVTVNKKIA